LFALFVLLYAISQVNEKKYDEVSASLAVAFGEVVNISDGNDSILPKAGDNIPTLVLLQNTSTRWSTCFQDIQEL
jgi:flagellar motor protein MotB